MQNGRFTGSFDIFERVLDGVGLKFEVNKKSLTCPNGMKLKKYLQNMMNKIGDIHNIYSYNRYKKWCRKSAPFLIPLKNNFKDWEW